MFHANLKFELQRDATGKEREREVISRTTVYQSTLRQVKRQSMGSSCDRAKVSIEKRMRWRRLIDSLYPLEMIYDDEAQ